MNTQLDPDELIICPNSEEHWDPLAAGYELHKATRSEIESNGGICAVCRAKFAKSHAHILAGKIESPSQIEADHGLTIEHDHVGFDDSGEMGGIQDFDFAAIDGEIDGHAEDVRAQAGILIARLLSWIWTSSDSKRKTMDPRTAFIRFTALSSALRSDLCPFNQP